MLSRDTFLIFAGFTVLWAACSIPVLLSPLGSYQVVDAAWHSAWASEVADGNIGVYAPYFRAPLYPLMLGLFYSVTGSSPLTGVFLSYLFSLLCVLTVYRFVLLRSGRRAALLSAFFTGVNGVFMFYSSTLLIASFYMFLLLLSFYLFEKREPSKYGWFVLGLAACARPSAVLLFPLAFTVYPGVRKHFWLWLVPVCAVWAVNWSAGDPGTVLSSQGGINLYIGSGPEADGYTSFAPDARGSGVLPDSLPYIDNVWAASVRPFGESASPSEISAWWTRKALSHIASNPGSSAALFLRKALYIISPVAIPSNYDVYYCTACSPVAGILTGMPEIPVSGLLLWLLLPGAALAGALLPGEKNALLWAGVLALGVLPFFVTARFLLPTLPFMVIFLVPRFIRKPVKALYLAPIGLAAGLGLARLTADTVYSSGVNMAFHDGLAHYQKGYYEKSELLFLQSLDVAFERTDGIDLNGTDALFNLGVLALKRGELNEAENFFRLALGRNPDFLPAAQALQGLTR